MPDEPRSLGRMLHDAARRFARREALLFEGQSMTYRELDLASNKTANALAGLGIGRGDRVAIMLPNIPEFVTVFFGIQKLGAVAVPFNTLYKGREIVHILNDCGARAIVTLTHFSAFIQEIRSETPALEQVIVTGQRTLLFVEPGATGAALWVVEQDVLGDGDEAYRRIGGILEDALRALGAAEVCYRHRGGLRVYGRKIGAFQVQTHENLYLVSALVFLEPWDPEPFFRVVWVPPEIKDKVLEPMTSLREVIGAAADSEAFRAALLNACRARLGVEFEPGAFLRDERFGYEKARALAGRKPRTRR